MTGTLKKLIWVLLVNLIFSYSLVYITYKRWDINKYPQDSPAYIALVENDIFHNDVGYRFKYRILTPLIVKSLLNFVPQIDIEITAHLDRQKKQIFYIFCWVNYVFVILTSVLLFLYAVKYYSISNHIAHIGSFFYLLSFHTLSNHLIPLVDAGACFFIILLLIFEREKRWKWFGICAVLAVLQKEVVILVVLFILALEWLHHFSRRTIPYFFLLIPPVIIYFVFKSLSPMPDNAAHQFAWAHYFKHLICFFQTNTYNTSFLTQNILPFCPLLAVFACHAGLYYKKFKVNYPLLNLLIIPGLAIVSVFFGVFGGNIGRVVSLGFPVYFIYELKVLETVFREIRIE